MGKTRDQDTWSTEACDNTQVSKLFYKQICFLGTPGWLIDLSRFKNMVLMELRLHR